MSFTASKISPEEEYQGTNRLILGIVLLVLTYWLFGQSMQAALIPSITDSLGIKGNAGKEDVLNFAASLAPLFAAACVVTCGSLADRFGRMRFALIGAILSIAGSLIVATATHVEVLVIGRALQGISAACIMPSTIALIKSCFHEKKQATALTCWSIGSWGGSGFCALVAGMIEPRFGWQAMFWINAGVAALGILLILGTPESKAHETNTKFDTLGSIYFVVALIALVLAISKGRSWGYGDVKFIGTLVASTIIFILFFFHEKRAESKNITQLVDFSLFKSRGYFGVILSNLSLNAIAGAMVIVNTYLINGRGLNTTDVGFITLAYAVAVLVLIPVGQKILFKFGNRLPMVFGCAVCLSGVALMSLTSIESLDTYTMLVRIGYALFGFGLGVFATPSTFTAVSAAPEEKAAVAAGIYKLSSFLGAAMGVALSLAVYSVFAATDIDKAASFGLLLNVGFGLLAILPIIFIMPKNIVSKPN